jgi:protein TonB
MGGNEFQPGNGVLSPIPIREVKPSYTADALRARAQGTVALTCVVQTDGSVKGCSVVQPLRGDFGLNDEAIKAAHQWQFRPGTRLGEPVPVRVRIELDFNLR